MLLFARTWFARDRRFQPAIAALGVLLLWRGVAAAQSPGGISTNLSDGTSDFLTITAASPPTPMSRMARVSKVQETGAIGRVLVGIPSSVSAGVPVHLMVSDDDTFDCADAIVTMSPLTVGNTTHLTAPFDFTGGEFFSFARAATTAFTPGGLSSGDVATRPSAALSASVPGGAGTGNDAIWSRRRRRVAVFVRMPGGVEAAVPGAVDLALLPMSIVLSCRDIDCPREGPDR